MSDRKFCDRCGLETPWTQSFTLIVRWFGPNESRRTNVYDLCPACEPKIDVTRVLEGTANVR